MIVEGELPAYYETLMNDIHLNAGRAGLVNLEKGESIRDYTWSSVAGGYAVPLGKRAVARGLLRRKITQSRRVSTSGEADRQRIVGENPAVL